MTKSFWFKVNGKLRPYHKYFAIVQADGDDLGTLAGNVEQPSDLSRLLYDFSIEAYKLITKYRGEAIYIGGDDILAFMPLAFSDNDSNGSLIKTVFDFCSELSCLYKDAVTSNVKN